MGIIVAFEIIDHGIEYPDFFQGCGVAHTEYTDVATGIGDSEEEALSDALGSLAFVAGWDVEGCEGLAKALAVASKIDEVSAYVAQNYVSPCEECDEDGCDGCEYEGDEDADTPYYYISVRVRGTNTEETADACAEHHWPAANS